MQAQQLSSFAIDLTRLHRRTVTSFYSNLVTRPTGRAVRMGLEQQLVELGSGTPCLSILDFSQVRILDYSCADEIVAKLLLRYSEKDRPVDVYFVARGLQEHHLDSVEAVLERHGLLLVAEEPEISPVLLGPCAPLLRRCWDVMIGRGGARLGELAAATGLPLDDVRDAVDCFVARRVAVAYGDGLVCPVPQLHQA
jgi:hypothetical protein